MKKEKKIVMALAVISIIVLSVCVVYKYIEHERNGENGDDEVGDDDDDEERTSPGGIHIKVIEGRVNDSKVDRVYIYIALYGGSEPLDMNEVVLHIISEPADDTASSIDLEYNYVDPGTPVSDERYGAMSIVDPNDAFPSILDQEGILRLEVVLGGSSCLPALPPNSYLDIKIIQALGGPTAQEEIRTPAEYPKNGTIIDLDKATELDHDIDDLIPIFTVEIRNHSPDTVNVTLNILNEKEEVVENKTITLKKNGDWAVDYAPGKGNFTVILFTDDNRSISDTFHLDDGITVWKKFNIREDEIEQVKIDM